jgi:hypothetical protein
MADISLTQSEADALIGMPKQRADDQEREYPALGGNISVPLVSTDKREHFMLDVSRGRIDLRKGTYQNRARQIIVLVRLDFNGSPHTNPDGEVIQCPHLHVYREGFGDKWAAPAPVDAFSNTNDLWHTLGEFMRFCHIVEPPFIRQGLFS